MSSNTYGYPELRDIMTYAKLSRGAQNTLVRLRVFCDAKRDGSFSLAVTQDQVLEWTGLSEGTWQQHARELSKIAALTIKKQKTGKAIIYLHPPFEWLQPVENPGRENPWQGKTLAGVSEEPDLENPGLPNLENPGLLIYSDSSSSDEVSDKGEVSPPAPPPPHSSDGANLKPFGPNPTPTPPPTQVAPATKKVGGIVNQPLPDTGPTDEDKYVIKDATHFNPTTRELELCNGSWMEFEKKLRAKYGANIDVPAILDDARLWMKAGMSDRARLDAIERAAAIMYPRNRAQSFNTPAPSNPLSSQSSNWRARK